VRLWVAFGGAALQRRVNDLLSAPALAAKVNSFESKGAAPQPPGFIIVTLLVI
jgi:hypothetical protein